MNLLEKLKEVDKEQNSLFNSACQKCRMVLQLQDLYFECSESKEWGQHSCECGISWKTSWQN